MKKIITICLCLTFLASSCDMGTDEESPDYLALALKEIGDNFCAKLDGEKLKFIPE